MLDSTSLEVISQFKQALRRSSDDSPSLSKYNRGLKLSTSSNVDKIYPKIVEYNSKSYRVLTNDSIEENTRRNKRRWTDDDEDEQEDGVDEFDMVSTVSELLSPLNHPSEIISHPAISKTYKSQTLNKLSMELIGLIEIEQNNLNWLNKLLQVLNGEDWFYLLEENLGLESYEGKQINHPKMKRLRKTSNEDVNGQEIHQEQHKEEPHDKPDNQEQNEQQEVVQEEVQQVKEEVEQHNEHEQNKQNSVDPFFAIPLALKKYEEYQNQLESNQNDNKLLAMKEDLINYLQVSIQRQHEYIKNLTTLRNGLIRADRLKKDLYKWSKEMYEKRSS